MIEHSGFSLPLDPLMKTDLIVDTEGDLIIDTELEKFVEDCPWMNVSMTQTWGALNTKGILITLYLKDQ